MSKISPGCQRVSIDLPIELYDKIWKMASEPPAIAFSEWCRRLLAHHAGYPMPPASQRNKMKVRLDGTAKLPRPAKRKRASK